MTQPPRRPSLPALALLFVSLALPRPACADDSAAALEKDVEALFAQVLGEDPLVAEEGREEILLLGRRAAPVVARHLQGKEAAERYFACELLGHLGDASVAPALVERLNDKDVFARSVRSAAARALVRLGDAKAVPALLAALQVREDAELQYESAQALGILRAAEAADPLIGLLTSDTRTYQDRFVAGAAALALGRLKSEKAVPELVKLLDKASVKEPGTDLSLAYYAVRALERIAGQNLGSLTAGDAARDETIKKWKEWNAQKQGKKPEDGGKKDEGGKEGGKKEEAGKGK